VDRHSAVLISTATLLYFKSITVFLRVELSSEIRGNNHFCPIVQSGRGNLLTTTISKTGRAAIKAQIQTAIITRIARSRVEKSFIRRGKLKIKK